MRFSQILAKFAVSLFTREWIEILSFSFSSSTDFWSPSLRGSGLKSIIPCIIIIRISSPSLRGSGLKCRTHSRPLQDNPVSLFTREWIEIKIIAPEVNQSMGLPLYEGVD